MQCINERMTANYGAPVIALENHTYRKRCLNKDDSKTWVCCNKKCGKSFVLAKIYKLPQTLKGRHF